MTTIYRHTVLLAAISAVYTQRKEIIDTIDGLIKENSEAGIFSIDVNGLSKPESFDVYYYYTHYGYEVVFTDYNPLVVIKWAPKPL